MTPLKQRSTAALSRLFAGLLAAFLAAMLLTAPTARADDLSWGINPGGDEQRSSFSYELDPGDEVNDSFEITNYGTSPLDLSLYGADGATSSSGALELLPATEPSSQIGAWVTVARKEITLAAGEQQEVDFTLAVPEDAQPGDYVGGMISSYLDTESGSTVSVDRRLATQLAVRVAGEGALSLQLGELDARAPIAWNPFAPVDATVVATLTNDGNLRARGPYTVTVAGPFGLGKTAQTFAAEEMLPGSSVQIEQTVSGLWPLAWQRVKVTMDTEGVDSMPGPSVSSSTAFWTLPAGWLGVLVLIVAAATVIGVRRARDWENEDEDTQDRTADIEAATSIK